MSTPKPFERPWIARARAALPDLRLPVAFALYGTVYIAWILTTDAPDEIRSLVANLGYLPLGLLAAAITWRISSFPDLPARQRQAWRLMTLACVLTAGSDILWTIDENVLGNDPSVGLANIGYLLYYPALLGSLMLLPDAIRSSREWLKFGLDAATVVVGGAMAIWHFVITPTVAAEAPSRLALIISLCYPIGDLLVLLGIAAVLLRCPRGPRQRPLLLLAGSIAAMMIADIVWAHLALAGDVQAGNIQDVPYMIQYVLFAMAAAAEGRRLRRHGGDDPEYAVRSVGGLPYISVVLGYGLMLAVAWQRASDGLFPLIVGGVSLTLLALARQVVAIRENVRLQRERSLLAGELRFKSMIQHSSDVVSIVDTDWTLRYVSPSAARTFGLPGSQLVGENLLALVHPEDAGDASTRLRESLHESRGYVHARWRFRCGDGTYIETDNICANLLADEHVRGLVVTTRDMTERSDFEAQLVHRAFHDPLTGLANRALFEDRVRHALSRRRGNLATLGVLFVDLDEFKSVNDTLGHATGDKLLQGAAERLLSFLRAFDTAARLGGDEFAVLIDDIRQQEHVTSVADRIAEAFKQPFIIDGREVMATASVGVALATADQTAEDLLRNADLAMYLAKQRGRAQTAIFEPGMHVAVLDRRELQEDLRLALDRNELSLAYMPIHSLDTQALVGAEALLRWMHPARGPIPPSVFVPIAEDTGLIVEIGRWVLHHACQDAQRWRTRMPSTTPMRVSVNLSGRQLPEPTLMEDVAAALRESGLAPRMLVLELTESMLLQHNAQALSVMRQLKAHGVRLAIDDFGTGYSSLTYLQQLPIDILKVDRAFVERLEHDPSAEAITRTIIALGQTMSLRTIAEGIETRRQAEQLRKLGCDFGQGFFYGMPMPAAELEAYAVRWNALTVV